MVIVNESAPPNTRQQEAEDPHMGWPIDKPALPIEHYAGEVEVNGK